MRNSILLICLILIWLMTASTCGDEPTQLPACQEGEAIGFAETGMAACRTFLDGGYPAPLPTCTSNEALTVDPDSVHCTPRSNVADLDQVAAQLGQLQDILSRGQATLVALPNPLLSSATFVGLTTLVTYGHFYAPHDSRVGMAGGAAQCEVTYGTGAHVCTPYELHQSVALGIVNGSKTIAKSWIYFPAWNRRTMNVLQPNNGVADTCEGYTRATQSEGYRGVAVEWGPLSTGAPGFTFHTDTSCSLFLPIACCL